MYRSDRLISYSDAIFSIALTLLVIEIRVPDHPGSGLAWALLGSWPQFLSFAVSFSIITVVWFNHHEMFHHIKHVDYKLIAYNTLLMLNIVLIPFVSSILGHAFVLESFDSKLGCMLYGLWISIGGIPFNLIWVHAQANRALLHDSTDQNLVMTLRRHYRKGPVLYLLAACLAWISIWLSVAAYALLIAMYFLPGSLLKQRPAPRPPCLGGDPT